MDRRGLKRSNDTADNSNNERNTRICRNAEDNNAIEYNAGNSSRTSNEIIRIIRREPNLVVEVGSEGARHTSTRQIPPLYSFTSRPILSSLLPMLTRTSFRVPASQMPVPSTSRSIVGMNANIPNNWVRQQLMMERNRQYLSSSSNNSSDLQILTIYFRPILDGREFEPVDYADDPARGATPGEISRSTVVNIATENFIDDCCSICLSEFIINEKLRTLECNHSYHKSCIDGWLRNSRFCPICRKSLT